MKHLIAGNPLKNNQRKHDRKQLKTDVIVNDGIPNTGGVLRDMSVGGAAIVYSDVTTAAIDPLDIGQTLVLNFDGIGLMPGRVVRTFEGGYAAEFDFSISTR